MLTESIWKELGVTDSTLTVEEQEFLDENGYLSLGILLDTQQRQAILNRVNEILDEEGDNAGFELFDSPHIKHPKELGSDRLANLANKGKVFDIFYTHPKVLAAVRQVLGGDVKLSSLNYRAALPGYGLQKLHVDWKEPVEQGDYKVCNSIWLLDDFSAANGATRLVAGSHLWGKVPADVMENPEDPHPQEMILEAPAGTVVIFNSHTWHGGTTNTTSAPRRAIHSYFCRGDQPQQLDHQRYINAETRERISPSMRALLAVDQVN